MATATGVEARIREVMAGILEVDPERIDASFAREGAASWDSLNHLRLVSALEEALGVRFTMREVGELDGFEAIRRLVAERLPAGAGR
jgi:acyl carrier protein